MVGTIRYLSWETGELVILNACLRMYCKHLQTLSGSAWNKSEGMHCFEPSHAKAEAWSWRHLDLCMLPRLSYKGQQHLVVLQEAIPNDGICWSFLSMVWIVRHIFANYESENLAWRCMFFLFLSRNDTLKSGTQFTILFCNGRWLTSFCCTAVLTTGIESVKPLQDKSTSMQLAGAFPGVQSVQGIV